MDSREDETSWRQHQPKLQNYVLSGFECHDHDSLSQKGGCGSETFGSDLGETRIPTVLLQKHNYAGRYPQKFLDESKVRVENKTIFPSTSQQTQGQRIAKTVRISQRYRGKL